MNINIEALKYFHRLRHEMFSHGAARNMTLHTFSDDFEDWARRTQRYVEIRMYPEFMKFGLDDAGIVHGSESELLRALDRKAHPSFRISKREAISDGRK